MKTRLLLNSISAVLLLASTILVSCEKGNSTDTPQSDKPVITKVGTTVGEATTASIGTTGGSVLSADGRLTVVIPAGALASETNISIQRITNEAPLGLGSGYRLSPEGLTFAIPVELQFHYDNELLDNSPEDFLWIVTQAVDGSWNALLRSATDKSSKTVSVSTNHFSDWALGRFVDFVLAPPMAVVLKGHSVQLQLTGFVRDKNLSEEEELVPLIPITGDGDGLTPLTPIPPVESRLVDFKVKQWTLNGSAAPVSNNSGSLNASGNTATYKAPEQMPSINPVAVSVQVETSNKEGSKATFLVTSNITVIETDLYVLIKIDGKKYEYYQYGLNGAVPPDPDNFSLVNCGIEDNGNLGIVAAIISSTAPSKNIFEFVFSGPSETSKSLVGSNLDGEDDIAFSPEPGITYSIDYIHRGLNSNNECVRVNLCSDISATITSFSGLPNSIIRGYFSGTLYEDKPGYDYDCKTPDSHVIEGEFNLMRIN